MQRGFLNPERLPKFPPHISLAVTLLCALITNYVRWMFLMVLSAHAMGCQGRKYRDEISYGERNLCCAISLTHRCIQKLESLPAIVPATTIAEPKPDEVR